MNGRGREGRSGKDKRKDELSPMRQDRGLEECCTDPYAPCPPIRRQGVKAITYHIDIYKSTSDSHTSPIMCLSLAAGAHQQSLPSL